VVNGVALSGRSVEEIALALAEAAKAGKETVLIIHADANAAHQSVITVMEAARRSGLSQITFTAQTTNR
jgi:biopolymer transport protein ExbD